jgi:6-pyruvoyltetrahydropterin/6-carboxytetrahydropterin synthase
VIAMPPPAHEIDFCYGHRLLRYAGKCRHLHGHNGRAVIVFRQPHDESAANLADALRGLEAWIRASLDRRMILNDRDPAVRIFRELAEPVFLLPRNPTAENIARLIYDQAIARAIPACEVRLWETPRSYATYRGRD